MAVSTEEISESHTRSPVLMLAKWWRRLVREGWQTARQWKAGASAERLPHELAAGRPVGSGISHSTFVCHPKLQRKKARLRKMMRRGIPRVLNWLYHHLAFSIY